MIHHVSIPAREPQHVAEVLAELMNGKCLPFRPLEGAFMAASGDGTLIEVYPERTTLDIPDHERQVAFCENPAPPQTWPFPQTKKRKCGIQPAHQSLLTDVFGPAFSSARSISARTSRCVLVETENRALCT
jgi:hypothetical protein